MPIVGKRHKQGTRFFMVTRQRWRGRVTMFVPSCFAKNYREEKMPKRPSPARKDLYRLRELARKRRDDLVRNSRKNKVRVSIVGGK